MNNLLYQLRYFLGLGLSFILLCAWMSLSNDKIQLHLYLNSFHTSFLDFLFSYITWIGDGAFALFLLPYLVLFVEFRTFLISLFSCVIAGLLAQFFKKVIFADALRPGMLIPEEKLYIVDGIQLHSLHSFPSGHTTSAFTLFILLAFFNRKKYYLQIVFALAAIFIAYSRVYLSQHFLEDIAFGGILGIAAFLISFQLMQTWQFNRLNQPLFDWIFANQHKIIQYKEDFMARLAR